MACIALPPYRDVYLLDTNVVSELRRPAKANPRVVAWAGTTQVGALFVSAVTVLELEHGVLLMERKDAAQGSVLRSWLDGHVTPTFADRVLAVDAAVAKRCARLHVPDPRSERDALIAATAWVHGFVVVTRNVGDFAGMGVEIINPWAA